MHVEACNDIMGNDSYSACAILYSCLPSMYFWQLNTMIINDKEMEKIEDVQQKCAIMLNGTLKTVIYDQVI